jgi:type IV secretion system protein VirD4
VRQGALQKHAVTVALNAAVGLSAAVTIVVGGGWLHTEHVTPDAVDWLPAVASVTGAGTAWIAASAGTSTSRGVTLSSCALMTGIWGVTLAACEVMTWSNRGYAFDAVDMPNVGGFTIAVAITLACLQLLVQATPKTMRRSRQGAFGTASWMTMATAQDVFPSHGQVVVGEAYRVDLDATHAAPFSAKNRTTWGQGGAAPILGFDLGFDSTHMMFFAGSGGYKTTSTVVPTALRYAGSMVVLDPSAEVGPLVSASRERRGRKVVALDPRAELRYGFDAFATLMASKYREEDCAAFARLFVAESKGGSGGGSAEYFQSQSVNMLAGLLYLVATDEEYEAARSLATVRGLIAQPTKDVLAVLTTKAADENSAPFVRESLGQFVGMAEQTFSGVLSSVAKDTAWLSLPAYAGMVTGNRFGLGELSEGNLDVFVQIPGDTLKTYPGIGRVILGSLMKAMVQADGQHAQRVLFVLDEVDLLGYMGALEEARDRGRKYGITLMLLYQSLGQLEGHFGKDGATSWLEGCSFVSFAAIKSMETADAISQRCGQITIDVESTSRQHAGWFSKRDQTKSTSTAAQARNLILPHEVVQNMRADEQIIMVRGQPPLRCGRAIYFRRPDMRDDVGQNRFARPS